MDRLLGLICLSLFVLAAYGQTTEQRAVMVYPYKKCVDELKIDDDAYVEIPLVKGIPDGKQARIIGERVLYRPDCNAAFIKILPR